MLIKVQIPKKVSEKQIDLLQQFEKEGKDESFQSSSFIAGALKRLKDFMSGGGKPNNTKSSEKSEPAGNN